ncbi:MAG: amino acid ABC transporter permease [Thermodesulfobacteriota bacterium]|nr:amino acid ABC transporter permease [Thermodesulfobacteriota bacterium]
MQKINPWPGAFLCVLGLLFLCTGPCAAAGPDPYELLSQGTQALRQGDLDTALDLFLDVPCPKGTDDAGAFVRARVGAARIYFGRQAYLPCINTCDNILDRFPDNIEANNLKGQAIAAQIPGWLRFFKEMQTYFPTLLKATVMTLLLVLITMIASPVAGLFIALGRISRIKPLSALLWFYIWVFRGTPLLLQLFFIYYGLPQLGLVLDPFTAAVWGLSLNYSAYLAEIIRGGIESIDAGQMESAKAIGMTYGQAMRRVIIPQTYKRLIPPVGNEFIALIKDTALVSTIAMVELMRAANQIFNATFNISILVQAAIIYLIITSIFTVLFKRLEDRLGVYENR